MGRDTTDQTRAAEPGTAGARRLEALGRRVGGAYEQAAAAAEQAYAEAQAAYDEALHAAEHAYGDARAAADDAYAEARQRADELRAEGARLYERGLRRGRAYGERAARFTGDNKALALLLAAGVGYALAKALRRR